MKKEKYSSKKRKKHVKTIHERLRTCKVNEIRTIGEKEIQAGRVKLCSIRPSEWSDVIERFQKIILEHSKSSMVLNTGFNVQSAEPTRKTTEKEGTNNVIRGIVICVFKIFSSTRDGYRLHNILNLLLPYVASEDPRLLNELLELFLLAHRNLGYFRNATNIHFPIFVKYLFRMACGFSLPLKTLFAETISAKDLLSASTVTLTYEHEGGGKAGKGPKENKKVTIQAGPFLEKGDEVFLKPFEAYCGAVEGRNLTDAQKAELWSKIRFSCGVCSENNRILYLRIMFRMASLLTTLHRTSSNRAKEFTELFSIRKGYIEELCSGLKIDNLLPPLKRDIYYLLAYLFQNRTTTSLVLTQLVPQEESREFQGILLNQIKRLNQLGVKIPQDELTGLTFFLSKFVVHPSGNKVVRESASMLNQFVDMIKHKNGEINIYGLEFLYLVSTVNHSIRRLVNLGVVNESVKLITKAVNVELVFKQHGKKKAKKEEEKEGELTDEEKKMKERKKHKAMYKRLFEYAPKLLVQLFRANATTLEMRELVELGFVKSVSHILDIKNWKIYESKLVSDICSLVSILMNREPTSIPVWIQHGMYDTLEKYIVDAEKLDYPGEIVMILPKLLYSFSLNAECKEKIIQKKLFPMMLGWTVHPKMSLKFTNFNVVGAHAGQLSIFLRNNRGQNGEFMNVVDGCLKTLQDEIEKKKDILSSEDLDLRVFWEKKMIIEERKEIGDLIKREMTKEEIEKVKVQKKAQAEFVRTMRTFCSHLSILVKDDRVFAQEFVVRNGVRKCFDILTRFPIILNDQEPRILVNPIINIFAHLFRQKPDDTMKQVVQCSLEYSEKMEKELRSDTHFEDTKENRKYLYVTYSSISCFSKMFKMLRSIMIMRNWKDTQLLKYMESLAKMERRMKWAMSELSIETEQENILEGKKLFEKRLKEKEEFEKKKKEMKKEKKKKKKKKKSEKKTKPEEEEEEKKEKTPKKKEPVVVTRDPAKATIFRRIVRMYMSSLSQLYNSIQKTMFQLLMGQDRVQQYQIGMFFNEVIVNMVMKLVGSLVEIKSLDEMKKMISTKKTEECEMEDEDEPPKEVKKEEIELTKYCFYAKLILKDVHTLFFSESHRNTNTYVLKSFVDAGGLDILLPIAKKIFITYFDHSLYKEKSKPKDESPKKEEKEVKEEDKMKDEETETKKKRKKKKKVVEKYDVVEQTERSFAEIRSEGILTLMRFLQKMVNLNYIVQSPVTQAMLLTAPDFSSSKFLKLVQIQVSNVVVDLWEHPRLTKSKSLSTMDQDFLILMINIISHVVRGTDDEDEKKSKKNFQIDNAAFSRLLAMGFEEYKCQIALKKTNNDLQAAIDFIVMNPDLKREDTEGDEELAKAMALSLQANESVPILRNQGMEWVFKILRDTRSESLSFPCADLLAVLVDHDNDTEDSKKKKVSEKLMKRSSGLMKLQEEEEEEEDEEEEEVSRVETFAILVSQLLEENKNFSNPTDVNCKQFESVLKTILLLSQYRPSIKNWVSGQGYFLKKKREELKGIIEKKKDEEEKEKMEDEEEEKEREISIVPVILEVLNWIEKSELNMAVWDNLLMYCFKILESLTRPELGSPSTILRLIEDMGEEKDKKAKKTTKYQSKYGEFDVPEVDSLRKRYINRDCRRSLMEFQIRFLKNHIIDGTMEWNTFLRSKLLEIHKISMQEKKKQERLEAEKKKKEEEKKEKMKDEEDEGEEDDEEEEEEEEEDEEGEEDFDEEDFKLLEDYAPYSDKKLFGSTMKSFFGKEGRRKIRFPVAKETLQCFFSLLFNLTADAELAKIAIENGILDILLGLPSSFLTQKTMMQCQMIFGHLVEEEEFNFRKKVESVILEKLECRTKKKIRKKVVRHDATNDLDRAIQISLERERQQPEGGAGQGSQPPPTENTGGAGEQPPQPQSVTIDEKAKVKIVEKKVHTKLYVRILLNQLLDVLDEHVQRNPEWVFKTILDTCRIPPSETPIVESGGKKTKDTKSCPHLILKPDRNIHLLSVKVEKTKKDIFEKLIKLYNTHPSHSFPPKLVQKEDENAEETEDEETRTLGRLFDYMIPVPTYPSLQRNHILHILGTQITCHEDVRFLLSIRLPLVIKTTKKTSTKDETPPHKETLEVQESLLDVLIKNLHYSPPKGDLRRSTRRIDQGEGIPGTEAVNNLCVENKVKKLESMKKQYELSQKLIKYQMYRMSMFLLIKIASYEPSVVFDRLSVFLKTYLGSDYDCPPIYFEVEADVVYGISELFRWAMDISSHKPELLRFLCKLMVESDLVALLGQVLRRTSLDNPLFPSMGNSVLRLLERITKELGGVKSKNYKNKKRVLRWKGGRLPLKFKMDLLLSEEMESARQLLRAGVGMGGGGGGGLRRAPYQYYQDLVEESGLLGAQYISPHDLQDGGEEEARMFQNFALRYIREGRRPPRVGGGGGGGGGLGSFAQFLGRNQGGQGSLDESSSDSESSSDESDEEEEEEVDISIPPVPLVEDGSEDSDEDVNDSLEEHRMNQAMFGGLMLEDPPELEHDGIEDGGEEEEEEEGEEGAFLF